MNRSLYTRPNKPASMPVRRRRAQGPELAPVEVPEVIAVDRATECHVTPSSVAARMVDYLGPVGDYLTLEPQAGTGNLVQALLAAGYSPGGLVAVERHTALCSAIRARFTDGRSISLMNRCFLEYAQETAGKIEYPRIVMNPPFRAVKKHMDAALSLLGSGGHAEACLVALVPTTYEHEDARTIEVLDRDTFANAKVMTKIIKIEH